MPVTSAKLANDLDWQNLQAALSNGRSIPAVDGVLKRARGLGATSVIVENDYLDRDFSAEFSAFYAGVFKRFPKLCRRFHFFGEDITDLLNEADPQKIIESLNKISDSDRYLGYIVARPIQHAPLGRVVLAAPESAQATKSDLLVRSTYTTHLLGAVLRVTGTTYMQQDRRVGACAQAAIWMAARHLFSKHNGSPWVSTIDITEAASKPTDHMLSLALPAGSGGLTLEHMVRALREVGREPLLYHGNFDPTTKKITWPATIHPAAVIDRYVDSGIPVIVGLTPWAGQNELHAIVAVGHATKQLTSIDRLSSEPTRADYVRFLLVNDDQLGCYLRMPMAAGDALSETPYTVENIVYIIVPLPQKVYTPAESAEKLSWDLLRSYEAEWPTLEAKYRDKLGNSATGATHLITKLKANEVIARTYLTYGWRYKQRIIRNTCSPVLKDAVFRQDFSRYVWVTEFGTRESFNELDEKKIRVFAHSVVDATSSRFWEGRSIFHAPGFVWRWFHDPANPFDEYVNAILPIADDQPYGMKIRGSFTP